MLKVKYISHILCKKEFGVRMIRLTMKYSRKFSYFITKCVCCVYSLESPLQGDSNEYTQHTILCRRLIDFPELAIFASRPSAMINLHWLELPMLRKLFHGPKDVRAIEVRLSLHCIVQGPSLTNTAFFKIQIGRAV